MNKSKYIIKINLSIFLHFFYAYECEIFILNQLSFNTKILGLCMNLKKNRWFNQELFFKSVASSNLQVLIATKKNIVFKKKNLIHNVFIQYNTNTLVYFIRMSSLLRKCSPAHEWKKIQWSRKTGHTYLEE